MFAKVHNLQDTQHLICYPIEKQALYVDIFGVDMKRLHFDHYLPISRTMLIPFRAPDIQKPAFSFQVLPERAKWNSKVSSMTINA